MEVHLRSDRTYDLSITAQEAFKFASAQTSAEETAKYGTAISSFQASSKEERWALGGDPALARDVSSNDQKPDSGEAFNKWAQSIVDYPNFVNFSDMQALTPIWELCAGDEQSLMVKAALSKRFDTWATSKSNPLRTRPEYIDYLKVIWGDDPNPAVPEGYERVGIDLNAGAKGDYIFLCVHRQKYSPYGTNKQAVTDILVTFDDETAPPGYEKVYVDLNKGSGGKFIWLWYLKGDCD